MVFDAGCELAVWLNIMMQNKLYQLSGGITFVLGGARSGKSEFCEKLVLDSGLKPVYVATARGDDREMQQRIEVHQKRRNELISSGWETIEEPLTLADTLKNCTFEGRVILVDCLTLWVSNLMMAGADVVREGDDLVKILGRLKAPVVFVSNEVGMGIVPQNAMAREFRDLAGMLHQKIADASDHVYFIVAGQSLVMKAEA